MKYRRLGRSGLKVSEISLGSWLTFGKTVDESMATKTVHKAYELGINFLIRQMCMSEGSRANRSKCIKRISARVICYRN